MYLLTRHPYRMTGRTYISLIDITSAQIDRFILLLRNADKEKRMSFEIKHGMF